MHAWLYVAKIGENSKSCYIERETEKVYKEADVIKNEKSWKSSRVLLYTEHILTW